MQSSTGQYSTQAGDPAQPVQHSVITANSFGFFFLTVVRPFERGSYFNSSGTIPGCFCSVSAAIAANYTPVLGSQLSVLGPSWPPPVADPCRKVLLTAFVVLF